MVIENNTYDQYLKEATKIIDVNQNSNIHGKLTFKESSTILTLYIVNSELLFSEIMKNFDNFGIEVINHEYLTLNNKNENITVHNFSISGLPNHNLENDPQKQINFFETLGKVLENKWIESPFNKLSILYGLSLREINLLTALNAYNKQISKKYDNEHINQLISQYYDIFIQFIELFDLRLNPENHEIKKIEKKKIEINATLNQVIKLNDFQILKQFYEIICAIVRTNYYQNKEYISFKIKPILINCLQESNIFAEIFMYSKNVEGVHLRGGKISRGGFRWSDRKEDYRIEAYGLMKAQVKKNTIIVPTGAKAAFFISNIAANKHNKNYVVECYQTFIRSLLDITDNLNEKHEIMRPENVIMPVDLEKNIHADELADPYLVVAADKGTAKFSDFANQISKEYNFWLGDAFASGGSNGYDHKALAITSRGAWISVEKLFLEIHKDISKENFTAIGIGDMAGDVFGNGMLRSNKVQLLAAFNHIHIFIDPNPDTEKSFFERDRLFKMSTSTWLDYSPGIISEGGGVYSRQEKSIKINKTIAKLFHIPATLHELSPDELIKYILKAHVDLLWNGGIGTFVKAENESQEDAQDRTNDSIRINGDELNVKVVGEGGNVGFTQLGRIEYAKKGGKINTDFIDNSAGVSCSDREVNIKIALDAAIRHKKITFAERNDWLKQMETGICDLILKDNVLQNNALMIEESYKFLALDRHIYLLKKLEELKILNRKFEDVLNDNAIERLRLEKGFLTRPELAILLTYTKIWLKGEIINSDLPDNPYCEKFLLGYFPKVMQEKFREEILKHPLRREIITNYITNTLINRVGINFIPNVIEKTGANINDIIYAYLIIRDSFDFRDLWHDVEYTHSSAEIGAKIKSLLEIRKFAEYAICRFLRISHYNFSNLQENIIELSENINYIMDNFESLATKKNLADYKQKHVQYHKYGLAQNFAEKLAKINFLFFIPSIIYIYRNNSNIDLNIMIKLYFIVEEKLDSRNIRKDTANWICNDMMEENALAILIDDIAEEHNKIVNFIITKYCKNSKNEIDLLNSWSKDYEYAINKYLKTTKKIHFSGPVDYTILILILNRMKLLHD